MKSRTVAGLLLCAVILSLCGCSARKDSPDIRLKRESIDTIIMQKSYPIEGSEDNMFRQKEISEAEDIDALVEWIEGLQLVKGEVIGIDPRLVEYTIILEGVKDHLLVFTQGKVIYDGIVYDYENSEQALEAQQKYSLLNYEENEAQVVTDLKVRPS